MADVIEKNLPTHTTLDSDDALRIVKDYGTGAAESGKIDWDDFLVELNADSGFKPQRRVNSTTSSATPSINTDTTDYYRITALAVAITSFTTNLTGTPSAGQELTIEILDNGTARAITWGASFASTSIGTLPTTTTVNKILFVKLIWSVARSKWLCVGVANES